METGERVGGVGQVRADRADEGSKSRFVIGCGSQVMGKGGKVQGHLVDKWRMAINVLEDVETWQEGGTETDRGCSPSQTFFRFFKMLWSSSNLLQFKGYVCLLQ